MNLEKIQGLINTATEGATQSFAEQVDALKRFAAIDCGTYDEEGIAQAVEVAKTELAKIPGIQIKEVYLKGLGKEIIAKLTPENPQGKILLNAHLDTVFHKGDTARHPFHAEGDTAYGLGIADCKGGILVAIHAVKIMQQAHLLPNKEIVFLFDCDEEKAGTNYVLFDQEIPGTEMAFVFEPARGDNGIVTSRKGLCKLTIEVEGKKAHSGNNYLEGRSATVELAHKIVRLYENNDNERGIQFNVAKLYGGEDGIGTVSSAASAEVGVRVASQSDIDAFQAIIKKVEQDTYIEGTKTKIIVNRIGPFMERSAQNIKLYNLVHEAGILLGQDLPEQASGGGGDASYLSIKGVPTIDALGPYMYKIHSLDESLRLSSLPERTKLFAVVLGLLKLNQEGTQNGKC